MTGPSSPVLSAQENHAIFTQILDQHVKDGLVDYSAIKQDVRLNQYIEQLSATDPARLASRDARLAFWINAYNAYTLKIICDNYPIKSISELHTGGLALGTVMRTTVWHKKLVVINNEWTSLDAIEHKIIRKEFDEPRIHFAIVCAAKGCPPLRSEAYEADRLDVQLDEQARQFLSEKDKNSFDAKNKIARLSPIFSWFRKDFLKNSPSLLDYIIPFLPEDIGNSIRNNVGDWKVKYTPYDWTLNEQ